MFALRADEGGDRKASLPGVPRIVVPRLLRRPVRALARLFASDFELPPFAASAFSVALLASTGIYGVVVGGHVPVVLEAVTARTGMAVTAVKVNGNRETSEIDVISALGLNGYTSLAGLDVADARERVAALPWVSAVTIRKVYPNSIEVDLQEKTAFAIWQHRGELMLVERDGKPIAPLSGERHADLPLVVGAGAAERAAAFMAEVEGHPRIAEMASGYVRVAGRRWDLRLRNGVTVKLAAGRETEGLTILSRLDAEKDLMSRDIVAVDLRLHDRIAVQMSPEAMEARQAAMKDLTGKKGQRI